MDLIKTNKICATCCFCAENDSKHPECRRKSPQALPMQRPHPISGTVEVTVVPIFPPVGANLWCGEYAPKKEEQPIGGISKLSDIFEESERERALNDAETKAVPGFPKER